MSASAPRTKTQLLADIAALEQTIALSKGDIRSSRGRPSGIRPGSYSSTAHRAPYSMHPHNPPHHPQPSRGHRPHPYRSSYHPSQTRGNANRSMTFAHLPAAPSVNASSSSTLLPETQPPAVDEPPKIETDKTQDYTPSSSITQPNVTERLASHRVIMVDGVPFQFDATGTSLIKSDQAIPSRQVGLEHPSSKKQIPAQGFVRNGSKKLISTEVAKALRSSGLQKIADNRELRLKRQAMKLARKAAMTKTRSRRLCAYFTRTGTSYLICATKDDLHTFIFQGKCKNGPRCPFSHDATKKAICRGFLTKMCFEDPETCVLSHDPTPNRMPHCAHFLSAKGCHLGSDCMYPHINAGNVNVCLEFATLGYCERGLGCPLRHVFECPTFAAKGLCPDPKCRLPHVIKKDPSSRNKDNLPSLNPPETDSSPADDTDKMERTTRKGKRLHELLEERDDFISFGGSSSHQSVREDISESSESAVSDSDLESLSDTNA